MIVGLNIAKAAFIINQNSTYTTPYLVYILISILSLLGIGLIKVVNEIIMYKYN